MAKVQDSFLSGSNIHFIEGLYARFLEDPSSVDPSWRSLFEQYGRDGRPLVTNGKTSGALLQPAPAPALPTQSARGMELQARVDQTIYAFRLRGHLVAQIDPLRRPRSSLEHVADFGMVKSSHFSEAELEQWVATNGVFEQAQVRLRDLLTRL